MTHRNPVSYRSRLAAIGILLMVTAVPLVFLAVLYGSGGEMISSIQSQRERLSLAALVAFPVLLFALGVSVLWAGRTGSYALCIATSLIMAADFAAFARLVWLQLQPEPRPVIGTPDPKAVIHQVIVLGPPKAELRTVECSAKTRRCEGAALEVVGAVSPVRSQITPRYRKWESNQSAGQ